MIKRKKETTVKTEFKFTVGESDDTLTSNLINKHKTKEIKPDKPPCKSFIAVKRTVEMPHSVR